MITIHKRSIGMCLWLSIVTCGIYSIYWMYLLVKNIRSIEDNTSHCTKEMLCLVFVPFYSLYWWYVKGTVVKTRFSEHNHPVVGKGITYLLLSMFGFGLVSMAIMQHNFNSLKTKKHIEPHNTLVMRMRCRLPLILLVVLAMLICVTLALMMPFVFPTAYDLNGTLLGMTWWKAIMRHLVPPVALTLFVLPLWLEYHREYRAEKDFDAGKDTPSYFDEFKDGYKMRVLDEEYEKSTKEKRSVRNRKRKESDKG